MNRRRSIRPTRNISVAATAMLSDRVTGRDVLFVVGDIMPATTDDYSRARGRGYVPRTLYLAVQALPAKYRATVIGFTMARMFGGSDGQFLVALSQMRCHRGVSNGFYAAIFYLQIGVALVLFWIASRAFGSDA